MASRFWVGNGGAWTSTAHWSATSGGASGASVPTSADNVFFDANSFSSASQTVTIPAGTIAEVNNLDFTGTTNSPTLSLVFGGGGSTILRPYGNVTFITNMTVQGTDTENSIIQFNNATAKTFNPASATYKNNFSIYIVGGGKVTLTGHLINHGTDRPWRIEVDNGELDTAGFNVAARLLSFNTNNAKTLTLGSSTLDLQGLRMYNKNNLNVSAGTSTLRFGFVIAATNFDLEFGNYTWYNVQLSNTGPVYIYDSSTFNKLEFINTDARTVYFEDGTTQTVGSFVASKSPTSVSTITSISSGTFTLSKPTGTVAVSYMDISDSIATGGAGWFAANSTNSGSNTGWTFGTPTYTFEASVTRTGQTSGTLVSETATTTVGSSGTIRTAALTIVTFQLIPQKDYEYRVFDKTGSFIGVWQGVTSDPSWSQSVNQNADPLVVHISRSPDNRVVSQVALQDTAGSTITDTNGDIIYTTITTANAVGSGTDVDINLFIDVYVFYGGYDSLLDTSGNIIYDTNSDPIIVQYGSPNGKRVYSGYIADYDLIYGEKQGVDVTIVPHATELNHIVYKDISGNTKITWNSTDPVAMARDAMDRAIADGSIMTYDATSMPLSGQVASYTYNLQTAREVQDKAVDLLPYGYYWYPSVGERKVYMLNKSVTADHTFYYEQHITDLRLKRSITQMVNDVYFVGGDTGGGVDLYKHYTDATSISTYRRGLERMSDARVTLAGSAAALSQVEINSYKDPRYLTSVIITDAVYDIETISLGQMVAFKNFGSFVDNLVLQIVSIHREKHKVTLDLDMIVPSDAKRLEEIKRRINTQDVVAIAGAPS